MNTKLFKQIFGLLVVIGVINLIGVKLFLYWTLWWYDMIPHFFSGFVIGMASIYFANICKKINIKNKVLFAVFAGLVIGVLWEIYELYFGVTSLADGQAYVTDTLSDIILDLSGALLGSLYAKKIKN